MSVWKARGVTDFNTSPCGTSDKGVPVWYSNALSYETPATIRAKCAAILAQRKEASRG